MVEIADRHDTDREIKKSLLELYQIFLDMTVIVEVKTEAQPDMQQEVECLGTILLVLIILLVVINF